MKKVIVFFFLVFIAANVHGQNPIKDSATIKRISNHVLTNAHCYEDLRYLCKQIGNRISGSAQAEKAVYWAKKTLEEAGCDRVYLEEVMVPHWVRGEEEASYIINGRKIAMLVSSLGNAVGTGNNGVEAELLMVNNMDELERLSDAEVKGKIVFFNHRFDQTNVNTFSSYGPCVYYRWAAPSKAAKKGAVAAIVRSVSSADDDKPHTGSMSYDAKYQKIAAIAIGNKTADLLEKEIGRQESVKAYIRTTCQMLPDVKSYNVIGEIKGTEYPKEIIAFGGHLDSWDIGEGAHDDGAGVVEAIDVLRTFKQLNIKPKRTIRAVLWMNEENGLRGAKEYARQTKLKNENHILAIESDAGGATPYGFGLIMSPEKKKKVQSWSQLFYPYNIYNFSQEHGGADVNPLKRDFETPVMGLMPDSHRYFDMHHSANDVFENVHRRELAMGTIAMTMMVYLVSFYGL